MKNKKNNKYFLVIFIICLIIFLCSFLNKESDFFWHIKTGEYIFNNGFINKDVFSWSVLGKYWMSHEWLFELVIYSLKSLMGNIGLIIYIILFLSIIYGTIYKYNKDKILNNCYFTMIWFLFSLILIPFIQIRPHFISFAFLGVSLYFIYDLINNEHSKKIYFLPIVSILWANLHGGSSNLSYLLCLFTLIIGQFKFKFNKIEAKRLSKKQQKKLLIITIISFLSIFINMHGYKMVLYPYTNLLDKTMIESIKEWASTDINNIMHLPFFVLSIFILFIFLLSKRKIKFFDFALFGLGIFLGLKSIRFWPYLFIIASFFVFDYVEKFEFNNIKYLLIFGSGLFLFGAINNYKSFSYNLNKEYCYLDKNIVDIIKKEKPKALFNNYDFGGELIYHNIKVFVDGRADLYSENDILRSYMSIDFLDLDYLELIRKYNFDFYLIKNGSKLDSYLSRINDFEKIYDSKKIVLYKKTSS